MNSKDSVGPLALAGIGIGAIAACVGGYITHIIVVISVLTSSTVSTVSVGYGILLAIGIIVPPVGVIHGIGVWFGAW